MNAGKLGLLSVGLMFGLSACNLLGSSGPAITSFAANPAVITSGQSSVLTWNVDSSATSISISGGVGDVTNDSDNSATVMPTVTTDYTLTATNASGTSTKTATVTISNGPDSGGNNGGGNPASAPMGTFGVSTDATGTFSNDQGDAGPITSDDDERIIDVTPGSTFYAQVDYSDPDGIASVSIQLRNSSPDGLAGPLPAGGFTVGEPTGDCNVGSATAITCVYPITVDPTVVDISQLPGAGSEFAYVFRADVTDTLGNSALNTASGQNRGYVNIVQ